MTSARSHSGLLKWLLLVMLLGCGVPVSGQTAALKQVLAKDAGEKAPESPEEVRARLEKWHQEAREILERLEAPDASASLPKEITSEELEARVRDAEQMVIVGKRWLANLTAVEDARKTLEASRAAETAWKGFEGAPPYSFLMVDELLNERDAIQDKLTSYQASLLNYQGVLTTAVTEAKSAEDATSSMVSMVQKAGENEVPAAKWRLDAARAKSRVCAARAGFLQSGCESFTILIAATKIDLALIERKIQAARPNARLDDDDLAKIEQISNERKRSIRKEIEAVVQRLKSAQAARSKAQAALKDLTASASPGTKPEGLAVAEFRLQAADGRAESLQSVSESLESLIQLENFKVKNYQVRRKLLDAAKADDREKPLGELRAMIERLRAWENVLQNEISSSGADLSKLESRAATITTADPRFAFIGDQRAASNERLAAFRRLFQAASSERRLVERWAAEYAPDPGKPGYATSLATSAWQVAKKAWNLEVMSFEDKVEVDGQTVTGRIPVTIGMLLRAILFFTIGYLVSSRIANRVQNSLVERGFMMDAQARTLRNWAMIVVGVFLVLGTLAFLKIPLTVFAFFGGALAIGLGFGLQTLIKNFICGIIVLVERKIRVGDILDVDGIVGTVVEVNTRSSVIRSPDDVETMIPNSVFLENRVTNWTLSHSRVRRVVRVGVAYGTSPQKVMEILTESAGRHGLVCKEPAPFAVFEDFGDSALVFCLYYWVEMSGPASPMVIASDLRLMIEKKFHELGISVPFPQRDLRLTGDKPITVRIATEEK